MLKIHLGWPLNLLAAALLTACGGESASTDSTVAATVTSEAAQAQESTMPTAQAVGEIVHTALGAVRGDTVTEIGLSARIFRGVPYAAPPVGDLRWKAPQPAAPWDGVRDAIEWADRCPQGASSMGAGSAISEDCLYLNISTTAETDNDMQPVMVFYHGGGLTSGTGNSTTYNHPMLPNKGVVLVTVNSRLGPIGYLAHPALSAEDAHGVSGNYGTMDLTASLQWVQDNIKAFGGDPDNVTIFGESGGGSKVISQMASPRAHDLFHRAIVESGSYSVTENAVTLLEAAEERGSNLVAALGIDNESEDVLAEMRAKPWEEIIEAGRNRDVGFRASVVVDGHIVPESINTQFKEGTQADVPLIVGANTGERSLQADVPLMGNLHSASASSNTYVYNFSQLPKTWREEEGCVAFHGLELTYVFGAVPIGLQSPTTLALARGGSCTTSVPEHDDIDMQVADYAATIWAQFAKTGDPSVEGLVDWPTYSESTNVYLDIGAEPLIKEGIETAYIAPGGSE